MVQSLKRQQNQVFIVQIKIVWVQRKINVKDQLDAQKSECRGWDASEAACWGWGCLVRELKWFCLQLGHPGSIEAHGRTGGASSVTHLPQHTAPLLLIILISNKGKRRVRSRNDNGNEGKHVNGDPRTWEDLLPDVSDLCGSHLLVLHLNHSEAAHGVQGASVAHQVDRAPLLGKLCEGLPPEEIRH